MTERPFGMLTLSDYREQIRAAADGVLAAIVEGPTDVLVPSCPEWTIGRLVEHLGQVHEWVTGIVATGATPEKRPDESLGLRDGDALAAWYAERVNRLLDTLDEAGPDRPCWTHQPDNRQSMYWFRRQALETAIHHVDAELARDRPGHCDEALAADGVGEVLDVWIPIITKVMEPPGVAGPILLACTDRPERWLVFPGSSGTPLSQGPPVHQDQAGAATATIEGRAEDLLLVLWNRRPVDERITLAGDVELARRFLDSTLTP